MGESKLGQPLRFISNIKQRWNYLSDERDLLKVEYHIECILADHTFNKLYAVLSDIELTIRNSLHEQPFPFYKQDVPQ